MPERSSSKSTRGQSGGVTPGQRAKIEHATTEILANADNLQQAAEKVIAAVCKVLCWECGSCWGIEPSSSKAFVIGSWGRRRAAVDSFLSESEALLQGKLGLLVAKSKAESMRPVGLLRRAWKLGKPVWSSDVTTDKTFKRAALARQAGLRSAFAFPLVAGSRVVGVIELFGKDARPPDRELLRAMRYVSSQIGQYVQRKEAEEKAADTEQSFQDTIELAAIGIAHVSPAGRFIHANRWLCDLLGYSRAELCRRSVSDISHPEDLHATDAAKTKLHAGAVKSFQLEKRYVRKDGRIVWTHLTIAAKRDAAGKVLYDVAVFEDVTERKRGQELLRLEHEVIRSLAEADTSSDAMESTIRAVCQAEGWECGRFFRVDVNARLLRFAGTWSTDDDDVRRFVEASRELTYAPGVGLAGIAWQSGKPVWVSDIHRDQRVAQGGLARATGMHGAFVFPVSFNGETLGVLTFNSREVRIPEERLLIAIAIIGTQIGQYLRRRQAEESIRESEARFRSLTELSSDWYWEQDPSGRITKLVGNSPRGEAFSERSPEIGKLVWELPGIDKASPDWINQRERLMRREPFRDFVYSFKDRNASQWFVSVNGEPVYDQEGKFRGYRGTSRDITSRKDAEARIQFLATHDALTQLPNRLLFSQLLNHAIDTGRRYKRSFAVLFLDLDRFKFVNDNFGHDAGDELLKIIATRLKHSVRASDVVGRLGGDEFVILIQETQHESQVTTVARKILSTVLSPLSIGGHELRVTASIGIAMYPADSQDEAGLMKNADIAMYQAKEDGKNVYRFYRPSLKSKSAGKVALEAGLRNALERNELRLAYQPKQNLGTGLITGVEALLRWTSPTLGMISPAQFIPVAEETGLIVDIGRWVLRTAASQCVAWQKQGLPELTMAVNLSPRQFVDPELLADLASILRETGLKPSLLELEITESMVMHNTDQAVTLLREIKRMGVRLAIDDFGTGYSSLANLKRFPIDTLKVDRSFIQDIPGNVEDKTITQAIIAMGKTLGLSVVAEGVETADQKTFLKDHACDEMQGFYFSKPESAGHIADMLLKAMAIGQNSVKTTEA